MHVINVFKIGDLISFSVKFQQCLLLHVVMYMYIHVGHSIQSFIAMLRMEIEIS